MCGILGSIGLPLSDSVLSLLNHRGPDGSGLEKIITPEGQEVWLGHTRLAILDLSPAGHQPMKSHNGRWWISFNGEIYNHLELRNELNVSFRGHSDTETLVELINAIGPYKALKKLNGMYAFSALDTKKGCLYLARDPLGIKPLYYIQQNNQFVFSSEVRTLCHLFPRIGIDQNGLRQFLTLRYVPSPNTLWQNIERLPPGHILEVEVKDRKPRKIECFIEPCNERFQGSLQDAVEAYQSILASAVKRQMLSDVPVGVLLSGGIDSALVAAMARQGGQSPPCFTVGFGKEHLECEIEQARETAKVLNLPFKSITVTPDQLKDALPSIVKAVEEPLGTTSVMPMWYLVKRAKEEVTVVLTGQGSDEPWGGYFRYQVALLRQFMPLKFPLYVLTWILKYWHKRPDYIERGVRTLLADTEVKRILEACALFPEKERALLLGDDNDGGAGKTIEYWLRWIDKAGSLSEVERMMRLDSRMNLSDDLLLYGDKISMAFALEARVPMLDLELLNFVESLPIDFRIKWRQGKIVHKRMAEQYLPKEIVYRPKKAFRVPFGQWSRGPWKDWLEILLLDGLSDILNRKGLEQFWQEHLHARPDRSRQIFSLLMLSLWRQTRCNA